MRDRFFGYRQFRVLGLFTGTISRKSGWLRFCGYGLTWRNRDIHGLTFSERHGCTRVWQLGRWIFTLLRV